MDFKQILYTILVLMIFHCSTLFAQHLELIDNRVSGVHNGNLIRTRFTNYGILGHRYEKPSMEWPKGSGIEYGLEFAMFAGARITDESMTQYYIFTESYGDIYNMDEDPTGTYSYSWEPLPGYFNTLLPEGQQTIAMSNISKGPGMNKTRSILDCLDKIRFYCVFKKSSHCPGYLNILAGYWLIIKAVT